jgi:Zn finger protein HypA/HybF involved in hydrogenase expression
VEKKSDTRNLLVDLANLVSPYLNKIEKENKEDAQKINAIIVKIDQKSKLNEDELKDFFYLIKKYQTFIPPSERKKNI